MQFGNLIAFLGSAGLAFTATNGVSAQDYPNRVIRVYASEPGGNSDFNARLIAQGLSSALGQSVVVDNRGTIAAAVAAAKAPPDGYSLLALGSSLWLAPLTRKMPYDPVTDFAPITSTTKSPNVLVLHPSVPVKSVAELIALAKSRPGALNYSTSIAGTSSHLCAELFKSLTRVNMVGISYKGPASAHTALLSGEVHLSFGGATIVMPHLKSARLRALAVSSTEPSALFPGLPTVATTIPGFEFKEKQGSWAPAGTPAAIINRLNQEIVRYLNRADVREKLLNTGAEADPVTPEQFSASIRTEMIRMGKLIKDAGIQAE